ncbi:Hypothetical_protein [Hexamita inflata]|uniref:Hypothetical_protein n=1 Tax=Hexamita inflata TaxID=28002 RepID=A0AA86NHP3_9EUKA|nr:Hypothetical protein HINF_LOCUS7121 [Hexamita inflata]
MKIVVNICCLKICIYVFIFGCQSCDWKLRQRNRIRDGLDIREINLLEIRIDLNQLQADEGLEVKFESRYELSYVSGRVHVKKTRVQSRARERAQDEAADISDKYASPGLSIE